jgi:hypothetical protein
VYWVIHYVLCWRCDPCAGLPGCAVVLVGAGPVSGSDVNVDDWSETFAAGFRHAQYVYVIFTDAAELVFDRLKRVVHAKRMG